MSTSPTTGTSPTKGRSAQQPDSVKRLVAIAAIFTAIATIVAATPRIWHEYNVFRKLNVREEVQREVAPAVKREVAQQRRVDRIWLKSSLDSASKVSEAGRRVLLDSISILEGDMAALRLELGHSTSELSKMRIQAKQKDVKLARLQSALARLQAQINAKDAQIAAAGDEVYASQQEASTQKQLRQAKEGQTDSLSKVLAATRFSKDSIWTVNRRYEAMMRANENGRLALVRAAQYEEQALSRGKLGFWKHSRHERQNLVNESINQYHLAVGYGAWLQSDMARVKQHLASCL